MKRRIDLPGRRKLLVASLGVAAVSYAIGAACNGKTTSDSPTSGNLPAPPPTQTQPPTSGNLVAPPPMDAGEDAADASDDAGDGSDDASDATD